MDQVLWHKFSQHSDLREELLATGDAELIEVYNFFHSLTIAAPVLTARQDSKHDAFWGCGPDGAGRNELGKALVRLRTELRNQRAE